MLSPREYQIQLVSFIPPYLQANPDVDVSEALSAIILFADCDDEQLDSGNERKILLDLARAAEERRDPRDASAFRTPPTELARVIPLRHQRVPKV